MKFALLLFGLMMSVSAAWAQNPASPTSETKAKPVNERVVVQPYTKRVPPVAPERKVAPGPPAFAPRNTQAITAPVEAPKSDIPVRDEPQR